MLAPGVSQKRIAKHLGVSVRKVQRIARESGGPAGARSGPEAAPRLRLAPKVLLVRRGDVGGEPASGAADADAGGALPRVRRGLGLEPCVRRGPDVAGTDGGGLPTIPRQSEGRLGESDGMAPALVLQDAAVPRPAGSAVAVGRLARAAAGVRRRGPVGRLQAGRQVAHGLCLLHRPRRARASRPSPASIGEPPCTTKTSPKPSSTASSTAAASSPATARSCTLATHKDLPMSVDPLPHSPPSASIMPLGHASPCARLNSPKKTPAKPESNPTRPVSNPTEFPEPTI